MKWSALLFAHRFPFGAARFTHRPYNSVEEQLLESWIVPGAFVVARGGVENPPLPLFTHPGPGFAQIALDALHEDGPPLRVVISMDVGFVPRFKLRKARHHRVVGQHDARTKHTRFVALKTAAYKLDEIWTASKTGTCAVHWNKPMAAFHKFIERRKLFWGDFSVVGEEEDSVEFFEVLCIQRVNGCGVLKFNKFGREGIAQDGIIEVAVMVGTGMSEEKHTYATEVGFRDVGESRDSPEDNKCEWKSDGIFHAFL